MHRKELHLRRHVNVTYIVNVILTFTTSSGDTTGMGSRGEKD